MKETSSIRKHSCKQSEKGKIVGDFTVEEKHTSKKTKYGSHDRKDSSFSHVDEKINSIQNKIK